VLLDTMAELISDLDHAALVRLIVDRAIAVVRAERGLLFLENAAGELDVAVARDDAGQDLGPVRYSTTLVSQVHRTGQGVCLKVGDSETGDLSASVVDLKLRAVMCVRLRVREKVLGVIYVDSKVSTREFSTKDLRFFDALAVALAIALENARLVREALERQRLQQAMEIAEQILESLLPPDPTGIAGFDVAGRSIPAESAAGDYYDLVRCGDGRLGIVVGDVTGHGIGPAMIMTGARSALRTMFADDRDEADILERLNRRLSEDLADDMFMSMMVCRLDPGGRRLTWANAGQSSPLLLRADGKAQRLEGTGLALGIDEDVSYEAQETLELHPGDVLALFTDGILEARNAADEMFGYAGIERVLREHRASPAGALVEAVIAAANEFAGGAVAEDDLTLVVVKARE